MSDTQGPFAVALRAECESCGAPAIGDKGRGIRRVEPSTREQECRVVGSTLDQTINCNQVGRATIADDQDVFLVEYGGGDILGQAGRRPAGQNLTSEEGQGRDEDTGCDEPNDHPGQY